MRRRRVRAGEPMEMGVSGDSGEATMTMTSIRLPLWLRLVLIAGVALLAAGAGLFGYLSVPKI